MPMQFINDYFLPRMFYEGTNDFKEIKSESHQVEEVGVTIALLGNEVRDRFMVALYGNEGVSQEDEGVYYFDDEKEAEQFYKTMRREHFPSNDDYEFKDG